MINIRRIDIDDVVDAALGNKVENLLREFTVRVNHANAAASTNILNHHILEERGFSHAGFPNHVHMPPAVINFDAKFAVFVSKIGSPKKSDIVHINN
jgi:hypothetical protein